MKALSLFLLFVTSVYVRAQVTHPHPHRAIQFPDVPGYLTLSCDFHQHTVFSDGSVWPDIRVHEALRDSIDAISLTEHLEYQPHLEDIPHPDRNRAYIIAESTARPYNLIVVRGAEITRDMPPGHNNAIFIQDANKLLIKDSLEVFKEARRQGAFTFWNHPNWIAQKKDGVATLTDFHKYLIKEGLLQGIEIVNESTYSEEAFQIALDNNLTLMGTSDIHGLIDWQFKVPEGGHRPVTLVFARERSADAIKDGLENRRSVVWFNNTLIGRPEHLLPLIESCIAIEKAEFIGPSSVAKVRLKNNSDAAFLLFNESPYSFHEHADLVVLEPHQTTEIQVKLKKDINNFELNFDVLNAITAPNQHARYLLKVAIP